VNYTKELSRFIVELRIERLPQDVIEAAKKSLLDWIGVTLGGSKDTVIQILMDVLNEIDGKGQSSIIGHNSRTTMLNAALINGTMSHILDYDDAHSVVRTHPSAPLVPALLVVAEHRALSGRELITALIAGLEATIRIGYALGKGYYEKGWHATSVLGRLGAAAGVAKLLNLNMGQTSVALGLAATQAGGVRDVFGTMGKPFHAGKAAMDGLLAALLAKRDFSGPSDLLNPEAGFSHVFSDEYDPTFIVNGLGVEYKTLENTFKPYAACLLAHPVIDGLITLKKEHNVEPDTIKEINIWVASLNLKVAGNPEPENGTQAKFSIHAAAALASIYGQATNSMFSNEIINDPRLRALMSKVKPLVDDTLAETEAELTVVLDNGKHHSIHVVTPKGDPRNPLTFDDIAEKMRDLAQGVLSRDATDQIVGLTEDLENLDNVARLLNLCRTEQC
jgi:2-methylcitrate dehydratase PrpD